MIVAILVAFSASLLAIRTPDDLDMRRELAEAVVLATSDPWEQLQLVKLARFESNYRRDVATCTRLGPSGERTAWQILPRSDEERRALCVTLEADAKIAVARLREAVKACPELPPPERLAVYARGRCSSAEGRRLSRHRWVTWSPAP